MTNDPVEQHRRYALGELKRFANVDYWFQPCLFDTITKERFPCSEEFLAIEEQRYFAAK